MAVIYKALYGMEGSWSCKIYRYKKSTDTYTYVSANSSSFDYFDDDAGVGDILYIGSRGCKTRPFDGILFYVGTAISASGITITPEYYNHYANDWETIKDYRDETEQFTRTGEHKFYFDITKQTGITSTSVNSNILLWIRFRITALDSISEGGAQSNQEIKYQADAIIVSDYSNDSPATFDDIYNADKSNSFELLAPIVPSTGLVFTYQVRPTDKLALNISFTLSSDTDAVSGDTVVIHGNDIDGNSLDETIDVSGGAGTYTTTNKFSSISSIDCNGFSAGTISVSQPQWGLVWNIVPNQFAFGKKLMIDASSVDTYFADKGKQVIFLDGIAQDYFDNYAFVTVGTPHITLGELVSGKETRNGCSIQSNEHKYYSRVFTGSDSAIVNLYGCRFHSESNNGRLYISVLGDAFNCIFDNYAYMETIGGKSNVYNVLSEYTESAIRVRAATIIEKLTGIGVAQGIRFLADDITVNEFYARVRGDYGIVCQDGPTEGHWEKLINPDIDNWTILWEYSKIKGTIYRQYTIDLKVIDENGNPISGACVVLKDKNNNIVFSEIVGDNGVIFEQTVTYGYYTQATGNTLQSYSPHILTVSKPGYQKYEEKFILVERINWMITLKKISINVDNEVIC